MNKYWKKTEEGEYSFHIDEQKIGNMRISFDSIDSKAIVTINDKEYIIRRTGFWRNKIEVTNSSNEPIARIYGENWYSHSFWLDYDEKKYKLLIRNNPLSELAITYEKQDILAYGLKVDHTLGTVQIGINTSENSQNHLFDFILWYHFLPIAHENMGNDFSFIN